MPKTKANKGTFTKAKPGPGRPKGIPNKTTQAAKEAFALAFEGVGGIPELVRWAQLNRTDFYKLYARLIPVELSGEVKARIEIVDDVPPK